MDVAGELTVGSLNASTIEEELGSVSKRVFDRVVVKVLVNKLLPVPDLPIVSSTRGLGTHGPGILHPGKVINVVDIEIIETTTRRPNKAMESPDLIFQMAHVVGLFG